MAFETASGLGVNLQFFVDLLQMSPHSVDADVEFCGDELVAIPPRQ